MTSVRRAGGAQRQGSYEAAVSTQVGAGEDEIYVRALRRAGSNVQSAAEPGRFALREQSLAERFGDSASVAAQGEEAVNFRNCFDHCTGC